MDSNNRNREEKLKAAKLLHSALSKEGLETLKERQVVILDLDNGAYVTCPHCKRLAPVFHMTPVFDAENKFAGICHYCACSTRVLFPYVLFNAETRAKYKIGKSRVTLTECISIFEKIEDREYQDECLMSLGFKHGQRSIRKWGYVVLIMSLIFGLLTGYATKAYFGDVYAAFAVGGIVALASLNALLISTFEPFCTYIKHRDFFN